MKLSAPSFYRSVIVLSVTGITHKKEWAGTGDMKQRPHPVTLFLLSCFLLLVVSQLSPAQVGSTTAPIWVSTKEADENLQESQDSSSRVCNQVSMTGLRSQLGF